MDLEDEYLEKFDEILNMPKETIREAIVWWNEVAPEPFKRFVIASSYYETLLREAETIDKEFEQWNNDSILEDTEEE